ncbi:TPA: hypothetical protein DDZ86_01740 [Candidatus Dependentiae bacterium]|nr:MAG: hypothetical protein UW09_C0001G0289 [candidate division TM6 bacterium GW2011_GWF2_43_87]HBL98346.1 hypothetical protein [Candidatus Dependentiae bacterium]
MNKSLLVLVLGSLAMASHTADAMMSIKHLIRKNSEDKKSSEVPPKKRRSVSHLSPFAGLTEAEREELVTSKMLI